MVQFSLEQPQSSLYVNPCSYCYLESIKRNFQGKENQRGRNLETTSVETRSSWFIIIIFFIYSFRAHSLLHEWLCVSGTLQRQDDIYRLHYRLTQMDLYTFFFFLLFLCYTQLAVSLTFTKSKADTFLNMYILSFIFHFFFLFRLRVFILA